MEHLLLSSIESRIENNRSLYGRFQLGPFDRGQGLTVANAMRRTLLSELSGLAILCVEIQGVSHEYSNLKGVRESVLDVLLNLKQIVFISDEKFTQPEVGFLKVQGPAIIKAGDLKLPTFVQCVDPNQYIATLSDNGVLEMKFMICEGRNFLVQTSFKAIQKHFQSHFHNKNQSQDKLFSQTTLAQEFLNDSCQKKQSEENFETIRSGATQVSTKCFPRGLQNNNNISSTKTHFLHNQTDFQKFEKDLIFYKPKITKLQPGRNLSAKQNLKKKTSTNVLFIDAVFMPIKKVNFSIQNINDYSKIKHSHLLDKFQKNYSQEKIILEIWTNGSIHPRHAINQAAHKIIDILIPFQKTYLYKKTRLTVKPTVLNKVLFHSPNKFKNFQFTNSFTFSNTKDSLNYLRTQFKTQKKKKSIFTPILNKIYRPWETSTKFKNLENYLLIKQKKNIEYESLMYAGKKIELSQSTGNINFVAIKHRLESLDIAYLNLPAKSYVCLKRANINTIKNLLLYSPNELLSIKNLGAKSVKQIEKALTKTNLKLRSEVV
jgi:DNA-directed RNA polymerase alpha subunit